MINKFICFLIGHKKRHLPDKVCSRCGCRLGVPHFTDSVLPPPPKRFREIKNHGDPNFRKTL